MAGNEILGMGPIFGPVHLGMSPACSRASARPYASLSRAMPSPRLRRGRADTRMGRAGARERAGDIPKCSGTKMGRVPEISFPATFPSLPLNGLDLV